MNPANSQICCQTLAGLCALLLFWQHHQREWQWLHKEVTVNWHLARGHSCWLGAEQPPDSNLHSSGNNVVSWLWGWQNQIWGTVHGLKRSRKNNGQVWAPCGDSSRLGGWCQVAPLTTQSFLKRYLEAWIWIGRATCQSAPKITSLSPILNPMSW